jgi:hypothetical protein
MDDSDQMGVPSSNIADGCQVSKNGRQMQPIVDPSQHVASLSKVK